MTINAFIFARGGSKGLPRKNIKLLDGKPLISYSINVAKSLNIFSNIFVSTDCNEIASVSREYGANVIMRPEDLATDSSPEWLSWRHAISYVASEYGKFDKFVSLPATSPLRNKQDINRAIKKLEESNSDICISVTPASRSPYFNMVKLTNSGTCSIAIESELDLYRRQDAPKLFDITTVVYATKVDFILNKKSIFDGNVVAIEVPKERAVDIDDIYDFIYAESLIKGLNYES